MPILFETAETLEELWLADEQELSLAKMNQALDELSLFGYTFVDTANQVERIRECCPYELGVTKEQKQAFKIVIL